MLKAFGGYHDGQRVQVHDTIKPGEHFRLPRPHAHPVEINKLPVNSVLILHDDYVMETIRTPSIEVGFLRLANLSLETIVVKLFA